MKSRACVTMVLALATASASLAAAEPDRIPAGVKRIEPDRLAHYWLLDPS